MTLSPLPFYAINAFTTTSPHSGNQAGVVVFATDDDPRIQDDDYKLRVAKDVNYSETAFLVPLAPGRWNLRWWTPAVLCGHATLAAARVLFSLHPDLNDITFETRWSGELRAERIKDDGYSTSIKIFLPTWSEDTLTKLVASAEETTNRLQEKMAKILGVKVDEIEEIAPYVDAFEGTVTRLSPSVKLESLKPDVKAFLDFSPHMTLITQFDDKKSEDGRLAIKSRVHCPAFNIDEDPVTGSATSYLTAYWLKTPAFESVKKIVGDHRPGEITVHAAQVSERGGKLETRLLGNGQVSLIGAASEMSKGTLSVW